MLETRMHTVLPKGFVPDEYPPHEFGKHLQKWVEYKNQAHGSEAGIVNGSNGRERPIYHSNASGVIKEALSALHNTGIYNSRLHDGERRRNIDILAPVHRALYQDVREVLRAGPFRVVLPFANEAGTIGQVINYAQSVVGEEHVLAIDAGTQPQAGSEARAAGLRVIFQKDVLAKVDWDLLKRLGILPSRFSIRGAKGLTLFAGYLGLESTNELNNDIIQHDTDIVNAGPQRKEDEPHETDYCALEHIAAPYTFPLQDAIINAVYSLRTGEGRNNETWIQTANLIAEFSDDEKLMKLGKTLTTIAWPLTGERAINGILLRHFPIPTGMEIETQHDACIAGVELEHGTRQLMQVANPHQKIENRPSPRPREFAIVNQCAYWLSLLATHTDKTGRLPHQWNLEDIASFNAKYGGREFTVAVPPDDDHHGNQSVIVRTGFLIPSIHQLQSLNVVDWNSIRDIMQDT